MPDVTVDADLNVEEAGGAKRQLRTSDFGTGATGAAKESSLQQVLTELGQKLEPADLAALATAARQDAAKTVLDAILLAVDGLEGKDYATQATLAAAKTVLDNLLLAVDGLEGFTDGIEGKLDTLNVKDFATAAKQDAAKAVLDALLLAVDQVETNQTSQTTRLTEIRDGEESDFARLLKFQPRPGEEIRRDEQASEDYHGAAPDGTATTAPAWKVVRFEKDAGGNITRVRYRTGVAWDSRTAGW